MATSNSLLAALVLATLAALAVAQQPATSLPAVAGRMAALEGQAVLREESVLPAPHPPVLLGTAADFAILTKAGITTVSSAITGDIGVSPIAATGMTGFGLALDASKEFSTSPQLTGKAFAPDYVVPTPAKVTVAVGDMQTAYADAAGRALSGAPYLNIALGLISGQNFTAGVYRSLHPPIERLMFCHRESGASVTP